MKDIQHFLTQLIDIPSITGDEQKVSLFLKDYLSDKGMKIQLLPVTGNRTNFYATFEDDPVVILTTHMDTVSPFIPSRIEKDIVYGRGACDAKGIIAAMVYALLNLPKEFQKNVGLLFVVGEEVDSIGAKEAVKSGIKPGYFINGEPTQNKLVHAQKGTYFFNVSARGKATHSGYPEYGSSAIHMLMEYLDRLKNYPWPEDDKLGKTLFNVGRISGGEAINTLASTAQAECGIRVVTSAEDIDRILLHLKMDGIEIKTYTASDPVELYCPPQIKETINVNYGSDVFYLQKAAPVLMLGPGTILNAHTGHEHILVAELNEAVNKYQQLSKILVENHKKK
jgi:acetylornithine deacetylase/succinyl-diaminopimelate desuccinylase-like protein